MKFTKCELEIIIQWYSFTDCYFEERGNYLPKEDEILKEKIIGQIKKSSISF